MVRRSLACCTPEASWCDTSAVARHPSMWALQLRQHRTRSRPCDCGLSVTVHAPTGCGPLVIAALAPSEVLHALFRESCFSSLSPACDAFLARARRCEQMGPEIIYVSGRTRGAGEMNGKSANLNNCLRQVYPAGVRIPAHELACIFDADQARLVREP